MLGRIVDVLAAHTFTRTCTHAHTFWTGRERGRWERGKVCVCVCVREREREREHFLFREHILEMEERGRRKIGEEKEEEKERGTQKVERHREAV